MYTKSLLIATGDVKSYHHSLEVGEIEFMFSRGQKFAQAFIVTSESQTAVPEEIIGWEMISSWHWLDDKCWALNYDITAYHGHA